jgi:hypothetical protein
MQALDQWTAEFDRHNNIHMQMLGMFLTELLNEEGDSMRFMLVTWPDELPIAHQCLCSCPDAETIKTVLRHVIGAAELMLSETKFPTAGSA